MYHSVQNIVPSPVLPGNINVKIPKPIILAVLFHMDVNVILTTGF